MNLQYFKQQIELLTAHGLYTPETRLCFMYYTPTPKPCIMANWNTAAELEQLQGDFQSHSATFVPHFRNITGLIERPFDDEALAVFRKVQPFAKWENN